MTRVLLQIFSGLCFASLLSLAACSGGDKPSSEKEVVEADWDDLKFTGTNRFKYRSENFTGVATRKQKDGKVDMRVEMKDGVYDGVVEEWYPNEKKKTVSNFKEGKRHGKNTYWNEDGSLQKEQVWESGKLISDSSKKELVPAAGGE